MRNPPAFFLLVVYLVALSFSRLRLANAANIEALDSDFVFLEIRPTSLPLPEFSSKLGVFAKMDIPANELVCEYRGAVIPSTVPYESDYLFSTLDSQGNSMKIAPQPTELASNNLPICSYVNDCVNIYGQEYTADDILAIEAQKKALYTYPGTDYNLRSLTTKMGKVFLVASKPIPKDAELFFPYGGDYWIHRLKVGLLAKMEQPN